MSILLEKIFNKGNIMEYAAEHLKCHMLQVIMKRKGATDSISECPLPLICLTVF